MQINRLLDMLFILIDRRRVTAAQLARSLGVSVRTVYRDVDALSLANIPVSMTKGRGGGISIDENFVLDKTLLNESERREILSLGKIFGSVTPDSSGGIRKLISIFGELNDDWIEIDFDNWTNEDGAKELFETLKTAVKSKRAVSFEYYSKSGFSVRAVEPLKLCFKGQAWYLYAFCSSRNDYRFFKLSRMKNLELKDEFFMRSASSCVLKNFNGYNERFFDVKLRFSDSQAYRVYDTYGINIAAVERGGGLTTSMRVPEGDWIYQFAASFLGDCQIIEPETARRKMREIGERISLANSDDVARKTKNPK